MATLQQNGKNDTYITVKKVEFLKKSGIPRTWALRKKSTLGLQKNMGLRLGPIRAQVGPRPGLTTRNKHEYQIS